LPGILPKTRELESSLRDLIGEAEAAGLSLNDQLLRREQNIQKALLEIQQSEARIAQALTEAEALQGKLQVTRNETVRVIQDLKAGFERGVQAEKAKVEEIQSSAIVAPPQPAYSVQPPPVQPQGQRVPAELRSEFVEQTYPRTPLQQSVEVSTGEQALKSAGSARSTSTVVTNTPTSAADLKRVYQSAELLIKEGNPVESVASQMKLPIEGVKLLAQMIEIEREEDSRKQDPSGKFASTDSRLGALGGIRRQNSIL
jgi:hypothetical protein